MRIPKKKENKKTENEKYKKKRMKKKRNSLAYMHIINKRKLFDTLEENFKQLQYAKENRVYVDHPI